MEYIAKCQLCKWNEAWTAELAAQSAGVWHIFNQHRRHWLEIKGDRDPIDPLPETLGRKFKDWERQSA